MTNRISRILGTGEATEQSVKDALNATGSAPVYAPRAWVSFNAQGNSGFNNCDYVRSGTTVTVTIYGTTDAGFIVGSRIFFDVQTQVTGTATDGAFVLTGVSVVGSDTVVTFTHGSSGAATGLCNINLFTIYASGNVATVTDLGAGSNAVNFAVAMPDANYGYSVDCSLSNSSVPAVVMHWSGAQSASVAPTVYSCTFSLAGGGAYADAQYVSATFVR